MKALINNIRSVKEFFFPKPINISERREEIEKEYTNWLQAGKSLTNPHKVKQSIIKEYQQHFNCKIFVETGTYMGDMIDAQLQSFDKLYSIELQPSLYYRAKDRFKNEPKVHLLKGDSGKKLGGLMPKLTSTSLFWLDGHYSMGLTAKGDKECPILEELNAILTLSEFQHVILIDDARLFTGENDYPTIDQLKTFIEKYSSNLLLEIKDDVIRLTPQSV
ncbi:MAG: hypothetical protein RL713_1253 [Bacteroidota bacterium]|jgi:hypothetical protein